MSRCRSTIISTSRRQTFFMNVKARSRSASLGAFGLLGGRIRHVARRDRPRRRELRPRCRSAVRGRAPAAISSARHCRAAAGRSRFRAPRARRAPPCRTSRSADQPHCDNLAGAGIEPHESLAPAVEGVTAVIRRGRRRGLDSAALGLRPRRLASVSARQPRQGEPATSTQSGGTNVNAGRNKARHLGLRGKPRIRTARSTSRRLRQSSNLAPPQARNEAPTAWLRRP